MSNRILLALAILLLASAAGARIPEPLWEPAVDDRQNVTLAGREWMSVVTAWEEAGRVYSHPLETACVGLPKISYVDDHGPGVRPVLGQLLDGDFVLAFVRGDSLVIREGGPGYWTTIAVEYLGQPSPATSPIDMWVSPYPEFRDVVYLTLWSGVPWGDGGVRFVWRNAFGWQPLETPPGAVSDLYDMAHPQVVDHDGPYGPQPRIYYNHMGGDGILHSVQKLDGATWQAPASHPEALWFGDAFDVIRTPGGYAFLATGLQPVCPCNVLHFVEWSSLDGWGEAVDMGLSTDSFDWPRWPRLARDDDGRLHALWHHVGSDPSMAPHTTRLAYFLRDGGVWYDLADEIADHQSTGTESPVSITVDEYGETVFAWARRDTVEGVPQPSQIWVSFYDYCGDDAEPAIPAAPRVSAAPNPFNPSVTFTVTGAAAGAAEIYDALGRRVARRALSASAGGAIASWDGRDDAGREMPSGLYLVRVRGETGALATCKVVLAR